MCCACSLRSLRFANLVKGGTNIRKFSTARRCKKKGPVRRSYVADTSMDVDITTVIGVSITDAAATTTSNIRCYCIFRPPSIS